LRRNQTEAEKILWAHLRNKRFYGLKFFRQYSIGPYILDFYCPAINFGVELDGGQHNQCENEEYDASRSEYLKAQGIDVNRFWNHEVLLDTESVLAGLALKVSLLNPPSSPLTLRGEKSGGKVRMKGGGIKAAPAVMPEELQN
jgi:very-short-patch-repair endonuclease